MRTTSRRAVALIPDGASLMIGGFMGVGTPERVVDELVRQGKRDLTVIANDTAMPGQGIGKLVTRQARAQGDRQPHRPQSRDAAADDRRRDGGRAGAAGHADRAHPRRRLRPRRRAHADRRRHGGRGGQAEDRGRRPANTCWRLPLRADFALVQAFLADYLGNLTYALTARNFNPVIAMAADTVIVDADHIVPVGMISPDHVVTPAAARRLPHCHEPDPWTRRPSSPNASRSNCATACSSTSASASRRWSPTTFRAGMQVFFQSENGLIGTGPIPEEGMAQPALTDAGGRPVTALPGACTFDSAMSFGLIRGGHVDMTVLGGLQVDEHGQLANWMIPGKMVPGMGGAMDLVSGAKRVVIAMQHTRQGQVEDRASAARCR